MDVLKEMLSVAMTLIGLYSLMYMGTYMVERGKRAARKKLNVCEMCFTHIEEVHEIKKQKKNKR